MPNVQREAQIGLKLGREKYIAELSNDVVWNEATSSVSLYMKCVL